MINAEAEQVRTIFKLYLRLGSLNRLLAELHRRKIVTRVRRLSDGRKVGGISFARGSLGYLLRNRFYVGEVVYKGEILPGNHPPILDRGLFDAVQAKLAGQNNGPSLASSSAFEAPLIGRIFDDRGNRMSPSHTRKKGMAYRYYISAPLIQGQAERAGTIRRVPAVEVEKIVADALRREISSTQKTQSDERLLKDHVSRVEVHPNKLVVEIKALQDPNSTDRKGKRRTLQFPWKKPPSKCRREIIPPSSGNPRDLRPIRAERRATLIAAIAQGRAWLNDLATGTVNDIEAIAARERCSVRKVNMTISLAFLAPELVKAAVEGRLPRGLGVTRLYDPPAEWSRQYLKLGLAQT